MSYPKFSGNCPRNVRKDAKYTIRSGKNSPLVTIVYQAGNDERWYPSTDEHPQLVEMVNKVKSAHSAGLNGSFYINEYHQVIVPVVDDENYYLAGTYGAPLQFEFEGKVISGRPIDLEGHPIAAGAIWPGPHAGIRYVLAASGKDVYYETGIPRKMTKRVVLSNLIGREKAAMAASLVCEYKGAGGRFYVNEFGCMFAPIEEEQQKWEYRYMGKIDMENWFPNPLDVESESS